MNPRTSMQTTATTNTNLAGFAENTNGSIESLTATTCSIAETVYGRKVCKAHK